ncbi:hypothetical protein BDZ97DRAFT_1167638 [Flammula alnicola]|nr:hypothetical protein BDZ97DRAFT_1167638 [Flammula alnicola]
MAPTSSSRSRGPTSDKSRLSTWLSRVHARKGKEAAPSDTDKNLPVLDEFDSKEVHLGVELAAFAKKKTKKSTSSSSSYGTPSSCRSRSSWSSHASKDYPGSNHHNDTDFPYAYPLPGYPTSPLQEDMAMDPWPDQELTSAVSGIHEDELAMDGSESERQSRQENPNVEPQSMMEDQNHHPSLVEEKDRKLQVCFICQTTNMSLWIGDPDGLPLCIVCGNLYYR